MSKKLLVFSDSHGSVSAVKAVLTWAAKHLPPNDTICGAAFCGDGIADLKPAAESTGFYCDWKLVNGNNDYEYSMPESIVFDFCDYRFFMCHGHRHGIYTGFNSLVAAARSNEAQIVLFGHAHVPINKTESGILILNPGSVSRPRNRTGATFAVIECSPDNAPKVEFWGIGGRGQIKPVKL
jgi:putative phosphoesterase